MLVFADEDDRQYRFAAGQAVLDDRGEVGEVLRDDDALLLNGILVDRGVIAAGESRLGHSDGIVAERVQLRRRGARQHLVVDSRYIEWSATRAALRDDGSSVVDSPMARGWRRVGR